MTYYLPSQSSPDGERGEATRVDRATGGEMADLKIFWGPEICRLEYLIHLLDTGRIVDERRIRSA
jgi:hypothetical protein